MRVLVLGPRCDAVRDVLGGPECIPHEEPLTDVVLSRVRPDFLVSFGYRYLVSAHHLEAVGYRAVNVHMSLLPWNRGADPNLWSWLEHTPKGVSLHWMSSALDRGDIVVQREVTFAGSETLASSYTRLGRVGLELLGKQWHMLMSGSAPRTPQVGTGSYHRAADKNRHVTALPQGWQTLGSSVEEYGRRHGLWLS